jgi:hypothetical protein
VQDDEYAGPTRRTVVRTAGRAAWAAPVVVVAAAAPARANGSVVPNVDATQLLATRTNLLAPAPPTLADPARLTISVAYTNSGATATALTVTVRLVPDGDPVVVTDRIGETPDLTPESVAEGWMAQPSQGTGADRTFVFTRAGGLAASDSSTLRFQVRATTDILTTTPEGSGTVQAGAPVTTPSSTLNEGRAGTYPE